MYCEKSDVEKFLGTTIDTSIDIYIKSAEQIINNITGRTFGISAEDEERLFSGDNTDELIVDDLTEVTKLEVSDDLYGEVFSEIDEEDYILLPLNADKKGQSFTSIKLKYGVFPFGYGNHKVTGKFGYSAVPSDIIFACIALATGIYNYSTGGDEIKSESIGAYSVSYGGDQEGWTDLARVKEILKRYKRYHL